MADSSRPPDPPRRERAIPNEELFLVNLRDALRCRRCGLTPTRRDTYHRGFQYHHLVLWSEGGPNVAENLVLLCGRCHDLHHDGKVDDLPTVAGDPPASLTCHACGAQHDPRHLEVNCGWYRCPACRERVHLFDHFGYREEGGGSDTSSSMC